MARTVSRKQQTAASEDGGGWCDTGQRSTVGMRGLGEYSSRGGGGRRRAAGSHRRAASGTHLARRRGPGRGRVEGPPGHARVVDVAAAWRARLKWLLWRGGAREISAGGVHPVPTLLNQCRLSCKGMLSVF